MEPESDQKDTKSSRGVWELLDDLSWEIPFARPIFTFFVKEGKAVKSGWLAFLILGFVAAYIGYERGKAGKEMLKRSETNIY